MVNNIILQTQIISVYPNLEFEFAFALAKIHYKHPNTGLI